MMAYVVVVTNVGDLTVYRERSIEEVSQQSFSFGK